jgi:hypothetical protein
MTLPRLFCSASIVGLGLSLSTGVVVVGLSLPALAQVESFLWGPGSNVGPETKIEPTNCTTAADGSISCDTKVVNPPGDTPAKPQYRPFSY